MLSLDLDGRLLPARAARLARHLEACEGCARAADAMAATWARLDALPVPTASPDDFTVIAARARADAGGWRDVLDGWSTWRLAAAAAIACVLLGSGAGLALGSAAFGRGRALPLEAAALADGFGDLPFGSPAAGLARALASGTEATE